MPYENVVFFAIIGFVVVLAAIAYGFLSLCIFLIDKRREKNAKRNEQRLDDEFFDICMDDKLNKDEEYIKKVINSCKTHDQLHNTRIWLYGYYQRMRDFYKKKGYSEETCRDVFTNRLSRHLDTIHDMHAKITEDNILA